MGEKYAKHTVLTFGQHKGKMLKTVIEKDPEYILWVIRNIEWFDIDQQAEILLRECYEEKTGSKIQD